MKWYRFLARHRHLVLIFEAVLCVILLYIFDHELSIPFFLCLLLTYLPVVAVALYATFSVNKWTFLLEKQMQDVCDPYPLYEEMTDLLMHHKRPKGEEKALLMNQACALSRMGEYRNAYAILTSFNPDERPKLNPINRLIYTNNLFDIAMLCGYFDHADALYTDMKTQYDRLPPSASKSRLEDAMKGNEILMFFRRGDYRTVLHLLEERTPKNRCAAVEQAFLGAKACLALGDTEGARSRLDFVVREGNRLGFVAEAKAILETLS